MPKKKGCGCQEGSRVGAAYIVALPFLFLLTPLRASEARSWGIAFGGLLCAALVGKLYGMVRARTSAVAESSGAGRPDGAPATPSANGVHLSTGLTRTSTR